VLVDERGWRLFYSHWGAQHVDRQLAAGPVYAQRFAEAQQETDPRTGWLNDVWSEGGYVMDTTAGHLVFYGGFEFMHELDYRRAFFALLGQSWPGWRIDWAFGEIADLATCVGVDVDALRAREAPAFAASDAVGRVPSTVDISEGFWALMTARDSSGQVTAWPLDNLVRDHTIWAGEALASALPSEGAVREYVGRPPSFGLHLDLPGRRLGWWTASTCVAYEDVARRWPGWQVEFWQDRYERHVEACGGQVTLPSIDLRRGLDAVEARLDADLRDPAVSALKVVEQLRADGREVTVNPAVTVHTEVEPIESERTAIADALAAVRARLPLG
jgi:hypothetical protein